MGIPKMSPFPTRRGLFIFLHRHYSGMMNTSLKLPADLARARGLTLILTADQARASITELVAALILRGPLFTVSGSEWLPAFTLPRLLRKRTVEIKETLNHLRVARASTCYRLLDALSNLPLNGEPILVLDFFHTLYDPDIPLHVRFHVLRRCCRTLERLALYRPVILTTREMPTEDYKKFSPILQSIADETLRLEPDPERILQPALF